MSQILLAQILAPSIALTTSGGILALSYYTSPILRSITRLPHPGLTAFALKELRALFSSGSHVFPQLAMASTAVSLYLAWAIPGSRTGYTAAATGALSIAPFTVFIMVPACNARLIDLDKQAKGDEDGMRDEGEGNVEQRGEEVRALLSEFEKLNAIRAGLLALGGLAGIWTAMT